MGGELVRATKVVLGGAGDPLDLVGAVGRPGWGLVQLCDHVRRRIRKTVPEGAPLRRSIS